MFIPYLPMSTESPCTKSSRSEVKRWLKKKSVIINGSKPLPSDEISFPVNELVFFPKGRRKCTMW
jgi:hypothetical protein